MISPLDEPEQDPNGALLRKHTLGLAGHGAGESRTEGEHDESAHAPTQLAFGRALRRPRVTTGGRARGTASGR